MLNTLIELAARLCNAYDAVILLREGTALVLGAHHGPIPLDFVKWPISRAWAAGRRLGISWQGGRIFAHARNLLKMARDPDPIDKHVGNRICLRRLDIGCSQTKLAKAVGVTFQQVQKYEKGTNRIAASRLYKLAEILGVPITFFFDGLQRPR